MMTVTALVFHPDGTQTLEPREVPDAETEEAASPGGTQSTQN